MKRKLKLLYNFVLFSKQAGKAIRKTKIFTFIFQASIVIHLSVLSLGDSFDKYVCPPLGLSDIHTARALLKGRKGKKNEKYKNNKSSRANSNHD